MIRGESLNQPAGVVCCPLHPRHGPAGLPPRLTYLSHVRSLVSVRSTAREGMTMTDTISDTVRHGQEAYADAMRRWVDSVQTAITGAS